MANWRGLRAGITWMYWLHGDGNKFIIDGKEVLDSKGLADIIKRGTAGKTPVRLLSCSDLKSAQGLADHLGVDVIANNGLTRVHADGGVTVVAHSGNGTENWYRLRPGGDIGRAEVVDISTHTAKPNEYVELGAQKAKVVSGAGGAKGADILELTVNGKLIGKFSRGNSLEIIDGITLHGGNTITLSPNKTTTITGTLDDVNLVAKRGVNADETFNGITAANVENIGGINILRSPKWGQIKNKYKTVNGAGQKVYDWGKISDEFWETVNKPWLDDEITRGDNLRLVSNPSNTKAIYVTDDVGNFVLDANGNKIKSIFGREVDYLKSKGYTILSDGTAVK